MPVYVFYQGRLIDKRYKPATPQHAASELPAPSLLQFEGFNSPIDGRWIGSRRAHDLDLYHSGSYDPRDTPASFRKIRDVRHQQQRRRTVATEP